MADGIPTDPPRSRTIDFGALVKRALGDEFHKHEKVYQVGRGRTFESSDYGTQGLYRGKTAIDFSGTAAGGASGSIILGTDANGGAGDYVGHNLSVVDFGTTTQTSRIVAYNEATREARVVPSWSSSFILHTGTAQSGSAHSLTLGTGAPSALSGTLALTTGAASTQSRDLVSYDGTTKVATVAAWNDYGLADGTSANFLLDFADLGAGQVDTTVSRGGVSPTFTRATVAWTKLSTGLWAQVASGTPRSFYSGFDTGTGAYLGYLAEGARTNSALHGRLIATGVTATEWVESNVTAADNATGIGGVANSASTLTATANDGTILQTRTIASAAKTLSAFVRRKTGTGAVYITLDNDTTRTEITSLINSTTYTRVSATQTLANPVFGFKLAIDTDAIEVDMVMLENSASFASSPIPTTTAAVTRSTDVLTYPTTGWLNAAAGMLFADATFFTGANNFVGIYDATNFERVDFTMAGTKLRAEIIKGGVSEASLDSVASLADGVSFKSALTYAANDFAYSLDAATVLTDSSATLPTLTTVYVGYSNTFGGSWFGPIRRVAYFNVRLSNNTLRSITLTPPDSTTVYEVESPGPGVNTTYSISSTPFDA